MLDHYNSQNIWYLDFCGESSFSGLYPRSILPQNLLVIEDFLSKTKFSKQRVKGNSESEIFVKRFPCCQKIREALVIFGLKRYLIIYPDANTSIITI